jgi:hypothetical protein
MLATRRNGRAIFVPILVAIVSIAIVPRSFAEDSPSPKPNSQGRTPKLREVVEIPEDYVGRDLTFTARISTNGLWMKRVNAYFFLLVEDMEGSQLPPGGIGADSSVKLVRFILPIEEGRKLIDQLSADKKYDARIRFRIEREPNLFGNGWAYLARINSVEVSPAAMGR